MKKKNKNVMWFWDSVYMQEWCVIIVPTHKQFCELAKKETGFDIEITEDITGEFHGLTNPKGNSLGLIWAKDKDTNLTHEALHGTAWCLRNRGIFLCEENEEPYAYYLTYLIRTVKDYYKYDK